MTPEPALRFALLGPLRAALGDVELDLGPRLQRALLAILLTDANRVVPVDRLVDLLWRDEPPTAAMASLQAYVSQLRKVLEPDRAPRAPARVLVTEDPGYVLRVSEDRVDALRFASLVHRAHDELGHDPQQAANTIEAALSLWRGEPLAEFAGEPWAVPVVAKLTEAHDLAEEDQIDAWLALGRHAQAASELEPLVDARPLRERRWAQLMVATYRCGRQGDALRAYQRCRTVLADELGVEPGAELRRLEAAVLAQDASLEWRPTSAAAATGVEPRRAPNAADVDRPAAPTASVAAASLVGRGREMSLLRARIDNVAAGAGGAVVLAGEPGAGKTTLAEAAMTLAADADVAGAWVRCLDAASTPAYWPWTQLLAQLPDSPQVQLARRRVAGDVAGDPNDGTGQFKTYEALLAALTETTGQRPVVVVVDDVQAADESSLALLQMLAGDLHRLRILFVLTLRDTEPCLAVDQALGELLRHPGVERVGVGALSPADLTVLLRRVTGSDADPDVVAELMRRTGGNPFHATELIRLLSSEHPRGGVTAADVRALDVPAGVRDVLLRRVRRLPEDTQSLLTVAAVAGADLNPDLLERVTGLDTEQLLLAIEPAVAAGLVTAGGTGWSYRFRHPLIHETLAGAVRPVERARLHARIGDALEYVAPTDQATWLAQRAYHYLAAGPFGDTGKAIRYARDAADSALRQGAWRDAVRQLEQALAAITPAVPDPTGTRCDVLVELGKARRAGGMIREAHAAFEEALDLADQIGDEDRRLSAAVAFCAPSLWGSREWGETCGNLIALLERELARVPDDDPARRIRVMASLASELYFDADVDRGFAYATEALDLARQLGHGEELGIAACAYMLSGLVMDRLRDRRQLLDELLADHAVELTPMVQAVLHAHRLTEHLRYGDLAAFDVEYTQTWRLAVEVLGSPELQSQLLAARACRYALTGDVNKAEETARAGLQVMKTVNVTWDEPSEFVLTSALMLVGQTLTDHAEDLLSTAAAPRHPSLPHLAAPAAALAFALRGDLDRAREIAARWFAPPPRSWSWVQAVAYWAQVAVLTGEPDMEWLYERLAPHSGELAIVGVGVDCGGAVDSLLAGLAWRCGDLNRALEYAENGLALERKVGSAIWIRRTTQLIEHIRADIATAHATGVPAPRTPSDRDAARRRA